ncbi:GNAT family N-acetyltransferase [Deinococcus alpinitundrae]|uniref:GNAT family N-acetyltransferase n=1 Tax=Deinococcus alpinitundrae TaxID=468913 RepID=UPI001379634C|nr:GNAT family N-acetyltransferase [Deinococcus alpinitundrae]
MIRDAAAADFPAILAVINDAAEAYRGIIPADRWHEPYMGESELARQLAAGVRFRCFVEDSTVVGVMGIQDRGEVQLIRHAYVRTEHRSRGIGALLLADLIAGTDKPILIGTWQAATWAIRFYQKHGFRLVSDEEKTPLLKKFWVIPERQIETSVVLADRRYRPELAQQEGGPPPRE